MNTSSSNKLQALKSSFQAWKCASFGFALFSLILLASKWHQVSTDLNLLRGVDQLIWAHSGSAATGANETLASNGSTLAGAAWPQNLFLESLLWNKSLLENESHSTNETKHPQIAQHLHIILGREATGSELLRREVETFLGEFRSAKSTLCLSSLLVSVYIVSWILMTLAVNDTTISNDISLRNILLLSVFGSIDLAASVSFVIVRLIMFNVKNNSFMVQTIVPSESGDAPTRLGADQLAAFTALRLIAMRSCSAHVDIYVSAIVALLTLLRLYSIARAISYYRLLKRFLDAQRMIGTHNQQHQNSRQGNIFHSASNISFVTNGSANDEQPLVGYSSSSESSARNGLNSMLPTHNATKASAAWPSRALQMGQRHQTLHPANCDSTQLFASVDRRQHSGAIQQVAPEAQLEQQFLVASELGPLSSTYTANNHQLTFDLGDLQRRQHQEDNRSHHNRFSTAKSNLMVAPPRQQQLLEQPETRNNNDERDETGQKLHEENSVKPLAGRKQVKLHSQLNRLLLEQQKMIKGRQQLRQEFQSIGQPSGPPDLLLVNGRAHKLVSKRSNHSTGEQSNLSEMQANSFEADPNLVLEANWHQTEPKPRQKEAPTSSSFTLLSAKQLDKLSRKLLASAGPQQVLYGANNNTYAGSAAHSKYKLVARYRPTNGTLVTHKTGDPVSSTSAVSSSANESSCSSEANDSDGVANLTPNARETRATSPLSKQMAKSMRLTEELVSPSQAPPTSQRKNRRELLLDKYYYA